jgi:hypothetical protein
MRFALPVAAAAAVLADAPAARAHAIVGNRFFPATIATDDPGVADELSLPVVASSRTGDDPALREIDVEGEWSKRLTQHLGLSFGDGWTRLSGPDGQTANGFGNLETTLKYQALTSPAHEAIVALGVSYERGGSGAARIGAERHSTITPSIYFGKGAGDLPDSLDWARPSRSPAWSATPSPPALTRPTSGSPTCSAGAWPSNTACPTSQPMSATWACRTS